MGKAKLAPQSKPAVPCLELCAAVFAVEVAELVLEKIDLKPDTIKFYCDSKVVLRYIYKDTKHFYVYVHNRVQHILQSTKPEQCFYISSEHNPANHSSRSGLASHLTETTWLTVPAFLHEPDQVLHEEHASFELVDPEMDKETRPQFTSFATQIHFGNLTADRFK